MPTSRKPVLKHLAFCSLFLVAIISCTPTFDDEINQDLNPESPELISNELWISDAQKWTDPSISERTNYTLYSALPGTDEEIEMHFDKERNLFLIKTLSNNYFINNLYCEDGRIVFSEHIDLKTKDEWLVAYANEKPYAAALKDENTWISSHVDNLSLDFDLINTGLKEALTYQKKEITKRYHYRILNQRDLITDAFNSEISLAYTINVRKGEEVSIELENQPSGIYFTIKPNNGSDMEHIEWKGKVDTTGDMTITVFTVKPDPNQKFTLVTKVSNRQTQGYAQAN